MLFDFSTIAKRARAQIPVPDVPMERIVARSAARSRRSLRPLVISGVITLATIGTAAAFGTDIYNGVRLWVSGTNATVVIQSFAMVREPTAADLRRIVANAAFPAVLPMGLPSGMHISTVQYAPANRADMISIDYRNTRKNKHFGFTLFDSSTVNAGSAPEVRKARLTYHNSDYRWQVGRETVVSLKRFVAQRDADRIRAAMLAATPSESMSATLPLLSKATVLGIAPGLSQIAERYAPAGHSVVVGPHVVRDIPDFAKRGRPILDSRTVYLTSIPVIHGAPDYAHASLRWPHVVAISANGVRAINAVLRFTGTGRNCDCDIIYSEPNKTTYRIWKVHSDVVQKYNVDANSFAVTRIKG